MPAAAEQQLLVDDRRRGVNGLVKSVCGQRLQFRGIPDDQRGAFAPFTFQ
jgi:hypothetical protein